jgi:hypothetical protein
MARVNLDGKVWKDPRMKRLAKRRSWSLRETIGTCAAVWDVAYDNKTPIMPRIDVDTAAETDNFADDMVAEDLATPVGANLLDVRLRGVTERIEYLLTQAERGRKGGFAKAASGKKDGAFVANAKRTPSERLAPAYHSGALPLTLPLPLPPTPDLDPDPDQDRDHDRVAPDGARDDGPSEPLRLAGLLHELISKREPSGTIARQNPGKRKNTIANWSADIDKLHRLDGIDWQSIEAIIRWAQADSFWCGNILSGDSLRKKYDQLLDQSKRGKRSGNNASVGRVEPKDPSAYALDADDEF